MSTWAGVAKKTGVGINTQVYGSASDVWWDEDQPLSMLRTMMNPARVEFFVEVVTRELHVERRTINVLDVGCGVS